MTIENDTSTLPDSNVGGGVSMSAPVMETLLKRADFLAAARAKRCHAKGFVLQARQRETASPVIRVGYTCSKKVGNAVARNRAKRRLREIARALIPRHGKAGYDYVLIGRSGVTATRPYSELLSDLRDALATLHPEAR